MTGHYTGPLLLTIAGISLLIVGLAGLYWHYNTDYRRTRLSLTTRFRLWLAFAALAVVGFVMAALGLLLAGTAA